MLHLTQLRKRFPDTAHSTLCCGGVLHLAGAHSMRDARYMRTTLTLDDDVLEAARALSERRGTSIGAVISELARRGLAPRRAPDAEPATRNGIRLFPPRLGEPPVSPELVRRLLDEGE